MNRLRKLREKKNLYLSDIAKIIGKTANAVGQYELGRRDINTTDLMKLADFYNVSTDYILGRSDFQTTIEQEEVVQDIFNNLLTNTEKKKLEEISKKRKHSILEFIRFNLVEDSKEFKRTVIESEELQKYIAKIKSKREADNNG